MLLPRMAVSYVDIMPPAFFCAVVVRREDSVQAPYAEHYMRVAAWRDTPAADSSAMNGVADVVAARTIFDAQPRGSVVFAIRTGRIQNRQTPSYYGVAQRYGAKRRTRCAATFARRFDVAFFRAARDVEHTPSCPPQTYDDLPLMR